ncbi:MAG TPA: metal-dependent hydrolase [Burkholderiaceae bacterium]|jgi:inner membrane protein|nr:metal-dependent hydrolase [Burkholderiaceae bacterium]
MDPVSQIALGAAVGVAAMGRRTAVWKSVLVGGLCGMAPDLDIFIDHGDPIADMTRHRTETHALFYLTLVAPAIAAGVARLHGEMQHFRRWWLAVWLALVTHPLLDAMTVYGTQLALPFSDYPFGVGSIFIIDPLYTVPLLLGVVAALRARPERALRYNAAGLALSTLYLAWSAAAQQHVAAVAEASLRRHGIAAERVLVTPAPFSTLLWRVVAVGGDRYWEGFYSLLDREATLRFDAFARGVALHEAVRDHPPVARLAWFSHGFFKFEERAGEIRMADLRMGLEPTYTFTFVVAERRNPQLVPVAPRAVGARPDVRRWWPWLMRRLRGEPLAPPR